MKRQSTTSTDKKTVQNYQFQILMAEYSTIQESLHQHEQAQQQFFVVMGAFLALVAAADKVFSIDILSLWQYFPLASIFISAISMYFIMNGFIVGRFGLYIRLRLRPQIHQVITEGKLDIDEVLNWENFRVDFDKKFPFFGLSPLPQFILAIIPNISIMYYYVIVRPKSAFTLTDAFAIVALLVFIQTLLTLIYSARLFSISSTEDWEQFRFFRLNKKRKI